MSPTRRQVLAMGAGATALAVFGGARRLLVAPEPSGTTASVDELAQQLYEVLGSWREDASRPYEHPLRQVHNRGVPTQGPWVSFLPHEARQLVVDLVHASLSVRGRERLNAQQYVDLLSLQATKLLFFGKPGDAHYQVHLTGAHLFLRMGGKSREGIAFGGPQVWGDQRGDQEVGLPRNAYRDQLLLGQALFESLPTSARSAARVEKAPVQTAIEVQGIHGRFDGVPVADMSAQHRAQVRDLLASILDTYAEPDAAYAWECIARNGGVEAFHAADYDIDHQGGRRAGSSPSQIFRLESPAAIFHWRGEPHLHAFLNVAMDGETPLSVGDVITTHSSTLEAPAVRALFERVMAAEMKTEMAYYPEVTVAGRLRAGDVRTGDVYNLESWVNDIEVMEVLGKDFAPPLRASLEARGESIADQKTYRVATTDWVASNTEEMGFGGGRAVETGPLLRDAAIRYLQAHGVS